MAAIFPLMAVKRSGRSFATSSSLTATILPQPQLAGCGCREPGAVIGFVTDSRRRLRRRPHESQAWPHDEQFVSVFGKAPGRSYGNACLNASATRAATSLPTGLRE